MSGAGYSSRQVAARILVDVYRGETLDGALGKAFDGSSDGRVELSDRDRAFVRLLTATVLRRHGQIDQILLHHLEQGFPKKAAFALAVLRLAVAELVYLDQPGHAVLHNCVELVSRSPKVRHLKKLCNAVLRRVSENIPSLKESYDEPVANIPDWLLDKWGSHYGADSVAAFARAHLIEPPLDLSFKDAKSAQAFVDGLSGDMSGRVLPTGSVRLVKAGRLEQLGGFADGDWWVQDAAAALPVLLFGDVQGCKIVDLCAAPGGKTLQLASRGAEVVAVDASVKRLSLIEENLKRVGVDAQLVQADGREWRCDDPVDGVLVDAPCSATGTLRRHPDILLHRKADDIGRLCDIQRGLLENAASLVKSGGMIVYCTCSLEPEEGEAIIDSFLGNHPEFQRPPVVAADVAGCVEFLTPDGDVRTLPNQWVEAGGIDGFYAARLVRCR